MDILLSYHPIWLRIGLETIFNEILPMKSVDDFSTLSKFIHQVLFSIAVCVDTVLVVLVEGLFSCRHRVDML